MSGARAGSRSVWLRRGVQLAFLAFFFALVLATRPEPGRASSPWLSFFFDVDPLILLVTALAAHAVTVGLLLAFVTVVLTIVLGRVFCGWICPLGTVHAIASRFFDIWRPRRLREHWSRWHLSKYYVLIALLAMALFGVQWLALFDPIALLYRSVTTAVMPAAQWVAEDSSTAIYQTDPGVGDWKLTVVTEPTYEFVRDNFFVRQEQAFLGSGLILGFFLLTVCLNYMSRRFWCRYVCPLGGLLGLLAWRPWITRRVDTSACNECDLCGMTCHGAATSKPGAGWKPQECFGCLNCTDACPRDGLDFKVSLPWRPPPEQEAIDLSRRGLMGAALTGLAGLAFMRITPQARGVTYNPALVRPPGARAERDFLERCIACGLCMKICPTGGLQPAVTEAGLEGLWTPRLAPRIGYCDYECAACGEACPTGAIESLPLDAKKEIRIGLACIDTTRCIPYAYGRDCIVCEEHCPVPDKAIYFQEVEIVDREGAPKTVRQPRVDPELCIGCGICENVCPFRDQPAVRVTSANESRHPDNQPFLLGDNGSAYPE